MKLRQILEDYANPKKSKWSVVGLKHNYRQIGPSIFKHPSGCTFEISGPNWTHHDWGQGETKSGKGTDGLERILKLKDYYYKKYMPDVTGALEYAEPIDQDKKKELGELFNIDLR